MQPLLNIAIKAARSASRIIIRSFDHLDNLRIDKKGENDIVTAADQLAEQEIISIIHKSYPNHAIHSEEMGKSGDDDCEWIIDPLDGTVNFSRGIPHFCISIAVKYRDAIQCGIIYDPINHDMFTAASGDGAYLNSKRIRVSAQQKLQGALFNTSFSHNNPHNLKSYISIINALELNSAGIRRSGSAALDLAYLAAGRLDGVWQFDLKPWDIAAGSLLIKEAGGLISDFAGTNNYLDNGNTITANPKLFKQLSGIIKKCITENNATE